MNCKVTTIFFTASLFFIKNLVCMETQKLPNSEELLLLPYKKFDQTDNNGWRLIKDKIKAANLIIQYLTYNPNLLNLDKIQLYFHAGHLFACGENSKLANYFLNKAEEIISHEKRFDVDNYILNSLDYILCQSRLIKAFLCKDIPPLTNHLDNNKNLYPDVDIMVQRMIDNPDKPYNSFFQE